MSTVRLPDMPRDLPRMDGRKFALVRHRQRDIGIFLNIRRPIGFQAGRTSSIFVTTHVHPIYRLVDIRCLSPGAARKGKCSHNQTGQFEERI